MEQTDLQRHSYFIKHWAHSSLEAICLSGKALINAYAFPNEIDVFQKSTPSSKADDLTGMFRWMRSVETWRATPWNIRRHGAANKHTAAAARSIGPGDRLPLCKNRSSTSQTV